MGLIGDFVNSMGVENANVPLVMLVAVRVETALSKTAARRCLPKAFDKKRPPTAAVIIATRNADQRNVDFIRMFLQG